MGFVLQAARRYYGSKMASDRMLRSRSPWGWEGGLDRGVDVDMKAKNGRRRCTGQLKDSSWQLKDGSGRLIEGSRQLKKGMKR